MNIPLVWTIVVASLSAMIAGLSLGFASAGLKELRWFAALALTAGLFSVSNLGTLIPLSDEHVALASRFGATAMGAHVALWRPYLAAQARQPIGRRDRALVWATFSVGALALIPSTVVGAEVTHHDIPWLGARYNNAVITPFGNVVILIYFSLMLEVMVRYARRWRSGDKEAGLHGVALAAMLATGASDAVVANNLLRVPYLLDLGFMTVVVVVAIALIRRFVSNTRALYDLRRHLEREVAERSADLVAAQASLIQAEKLAAVGQLAAGLAHEINNPIAVIIANAGYLKDEYATARAWPHDTEACIDDTTTSARRVAAIVRQLLDAGRIATKRDTAIVFSVPTVVKAAITQARLGDAIAIAVDCPADLHAIGESGPIERVLVSLLTNAQEALSQSGRPGRIEVHASADAARIRLRVTDDGPGMSPQVARRAFEPFFTTKDVGAGTGLGLAAALGIVRSMGGDLTLERTTPSGTSMMITLDRAPEPKRD